MWLSATMATIWVSLRCEVMTSTSETPRGDLLRCMLIYMRRMALPPLHLRKFGVRHGFTQTYCSENAANAKVVSGFLRTSTASRVVS